MPSAARLACDDGANALFVMMSRACLGVAILLVFIHATGRSPWVTAKAPGSSWLAGISHTLAAVGLLASIRYIDVSLASIILSMYPFPVAIAAHPKGETALARPVLVLMVLATLGMALVIGVSFSSLDPRAIALAVMGMIGFAAMIISMSQLTHDVRAPNSSLLMTIWSMVIFAPVAGLGP